MKETRDVAPEELPLETPRKEKAMPSTPGVDRWPELPYAVWKDTCETLHLWTQIVGKIRLAQTPWLNLCWHVALYLTTARPDDLTDPYGARSLVGYPGHLWEVSTPNLPDQETGAGLLQT
jgi:hypothetical protein